MRAVMRNNQVWVKDGHLQNDLLTAVICWTNTQNTVVVAVNSIASFGVEVNQNVCKII